MNEDDLRTKLRAWRVEPEIPARFQADVWTRIAARETARENSVWRGMSERLFGTIARPAYAATLVVAFLGISLGTARIHADNANSRRLAALETRYVLSIDPYLKAQDRWTR